MLDDFTTTPINGLAGGTTATVYSNDTLNGVAFAPAASDTLDIQRWRADGRYHKQQWPVDIPAGTTAGTYNVIYQICETANLSNCDTAIAIVVVSAATIVANDDNFSPTPIIGVNGGTTTTVYVNDTLNGAPFVTPAVVSSILADGGLTGVGITANGELTVPAGTAPGSYVVTYQICEQVNILNCDPAFATLLVNPPVIDAVANDFSASPINGLVGGTTATVFANDTINGVAFVDAAVSGSIISDDNLTGVAITASGTLTVPAGTPAGNYDVIYQICEVANPGNCDTANATVLVNAATIIANDDDFSPTPINGFAGGTTTTVYVNDTLNGVAFAPAAVAAIITNDEG